MSFSGFYLTDKGSTLLAKAQTGKVINFTKAAWGSGDVPGGTNITALTALVSQVGTLQIAGLATAPQQAQITIQATNKDVTVPFLWKEIGVFATDPDEGEILYLYGNAGTAADTIQALSVGLNEFLFTVIAKIANTTSVTATINAGLIFATEAELTALSVTVGTKAPLASPNFTGIPIVPTAALDTSTMQAASTAFVLNQLSTATPLMDGTASPGSSTRSARGDHKHPADTSRAAAAHIHAESDITNLATDLAAKAPLASPAFTGTPTVPTPVQGTNSTVAVNAAFVMAAIAALVNSSPATLDTLKELADALGDDPNFAATMTALIGTKVAQTQTVNGHALTGPVTVTKADLGIPNVDNTHDNAKSVLYAATAGSAPSPYGLVISVGNGGSTGTYSGAGYLAISIPKNTKSTTAVPTYTLSEGETYFSPN